MASSTRPSAPPETLLYFAFGSNLSSTQMRDRCPGSVPIGLGYLANWDFIINEGGFANAVPSATPRRATTYTSTSTPAVITSTSRRRRSTFLTTPYPPSSSSTSKPQPRRRSSLDRPSPTSYTTTTKTTTTTTTTPTTRDPNSGVYGILWQLPSQREKRDLDRHEGVPAAYEDLVMPVELLDREGNGVGLVSALVYVDRRRVAPAPPRDEYVVRMNRGIEEAGREWGFPGGYVEGVMRRFIPPPLPPLPPSLSPSPPVGVEGVEVGGSDGGGGGGGDGGVSVNVSGGGGGGGGGRGGGGGEASKDEEREGSGKRNRRRFSRGFW